MYGKISDNQRVGELQMQIKFALRSVYQRHQYYLIFAKLKFIAQTNLFLQTTNEVLKWNSVDQVPTRTFFKWKPSVILPLFPLRHCFHDLFIFYLKSVSHTKIYGNGTILSSTYFRYRVAPLRCPYRLKEKVLFITIYHI